MFKITPPRWWTSSEAKVQSSTDADMKMAEVDVEPKLPNDDDTVDIERQDGTLLAHPVTPAPAPKQTIAFLDGLRGLAAFIVYWSHHTSWFFGPGDEIQNGFGYDGGSKYFATLPFVRLLWTGGHAGVAIFFVLSGYVLSRSPLRVLRDGGKPYQGLISATIRRPVRLFMPPALFSLIMAICLQLPIRPLLNWPPPQSNIFTELAKWFVDLLKALDPFMNHGIASVWFPYNPPIWTMPHEWKGSMLVFITVAAFSKVSSKTRNVLFAVTGILFMACLSWTMACFMAGVVLAANDLEELDKHMLERMTARTRAVVLHVIFFAGWFLLSMVQGDNLQTDPEKSYKIFGYYYITMLTPPNYYKNEYWRFWHSIGAVFLVYAVLRIRWIQKRLTSLKYLGKVSFSLYLSHLPFLWVVGDRIYRFFGFIRPESAELQSIFDAVLPVPNVGPKGLTLRWFVCQAVIFPLNMIVAHYGTIWIDEPSVTAGRWLSSKLMKESR